MSREAKSRRATVRSGLYGAMDGATKIVNLVGGMIIGIVQSG